MKTYNLNQLVSIETHRQMESTDYFWHQPKKSWFGKIKQPVIIDSWRNSFYCLASDFDTSDIELYCQLIDGVVYEKPEVVLNFIDKSSKTLWFYTMEEAVAKAKEIQQRAANAIWMSL